MIKEVYIRALADEFLEGSDRFVVRLTVSSDNLINVFIDGVTGVTISHCIDLSRHIEQTLDREEEDFELRVSSAGIDEEFVDPRQYIKNIDKAIELILDDDSKLRGILKEVSEELIKIAAEVKKGKKKSKKMQTGDVVEIPMIRIKKAKGIIIF